jgi:hypothetical protein
MIYCSLYKHRTITPYHTGKSGKIVIALEQLGSTEKEYPYKLEFKEELTFKCCTICDCDKSSFNDETKIFHPFLRTNE